MPDETNAIELKMLESAERYCTIYLMMFQDVIAWM